MGYDVEEQKRAIMAAEHAVAVMDGKMQMKLKPEAKRALTNAILRSGAQDDLLFRNKPVRHDPPWRSLSGLIARGVRLWRRYVKLPPEDAQQSLSDIQAGVRRSGGITLVIALLASLICGIGEVGLPGELALQMVRDKVRPVSASGDIVVIAQDERSVQQLGQWPWPRKYDAALIDKLREMGANRIVFRQSFSVPSTSENDQAFAAALTRANGKVWLGVKFNKDSLTGAHQTVIPMKLFRDRSLQTHNYVFFDAFGYSKNMPFSMRLDGKDYLSSATVLAGEKPETGSFRPDTAIRYRTIPTFSTIDILSGRIAHSAIAGKAVIISLTSADDDTQPILGQTPSNIPSVYTRVIAAETIKNGPTRELGWLPALIASILICLGCIVQRTRKDRVITLAVGTSAMLALMLISDRIGWHFEMMPALLALSIIGVRDVVRGKELALATNHPVSGLPNISEMKHLRNHATAGVAALKVERFTQTFGEYAFDEQRAVMRAIAARINIVCPESVIHQGNDGLFVWLLAIDPESGVPEISPQLRALFTQPVPGLTVAYSVRVGVGVCSVLQQPLGERVAVAAHGAGLNVFMKLQSVQ